MKEAVFNTEFLVELFPLCARFGHHRDYQENVSRQVYVIFRLNLLGDGMLPAEAIVRITDVNAHTLQSIINEASSMV